MDQAQSGVEANEQVAPAVQSDVENVASRASGEDPEARIAALIAENEKLARDRDNYRSATLALKGKAEVEDLDTSDPTQLAAFIQKQVDERLNETRATQADEDFKTYAKDLARKNKELALALQNKMGMAATGQGSGASSASESKVEYFSQEQLAEFKRRGWDEAKIKRAEERMRMMK